jgi:hypothetical protein
MWTKKEDKLRDGYWFHPVQIEGSTVPSASDFKGLQFDPNISGVGQEVDKCVEKLAFPSLPYGLEKFARLETQDDYLFVCLAFITVSFPLFSYLLTAHRSETHQSPNPVAFMQERRKRN